MGVIYEVWFVFDTVVSGRYFKRTTVPGRNGSKIKDWQPMYMSSHP